MTPARTIIDEMVAARRRGDGYVLHGEDLDAVVAMLRHAAAPAPALTDDPATTLLDTLVTAAGLDIPVKVSPGRVEALVGVLQLVPTLQRFLEMDDAEGWAYTIRHLAAARAAGVFQ
jgi:hypothetical protein